MRIIIAGSRNYNDYLTLKTKTLKVFKELKSLYPETKKDDIEIVSGCQRGADTLGEQFAKEFELKVKPFPADWFQYGKQAGPIRNELMARYAAEDNGVLIAFHLNNSPGTANMLKFAKQYGLKVYIFTKTEKYT